MPIANKTLTNFSGGELYRSVHGRLELPVYAKSVSICENFYILPEGGFEFRRGSRFTRYTRLNKKATLIPFVFSDEQSYALELTDKKMRFIYQDSYILETAKVITAMTNANPGVFTSNAHGFVNGDEIYISGIVGPTGINGKFYLIAGATTNTFTLTDIFGNAISTVASGAYTSGGTAGRVYEINTPYEELDLPYLQYAQSTDTMYITHRNYKPRKLIRSGHANWAVGTYVITGDPFVSTTKNITGATQANPGEITSAAHGFVENQLVFITGVVGMTRLNDRFYTVQNVTTNTFTLKTRDGQVVDTSAYTAYASGGTVTTPNNYPRSVAFTDAGRLCMSGTVSRPQTMWFSALPSTGNTDYDNFNVPATPTATSALAFTLGAVQGKADIIQWVVSTSKFLVVGTFGTLRRMYGSSEQSSISSTDFNAKPVNAFGCAQTLPTVNGDVLFYMQRANKKTRSLEYDLSADGYTTIDRNIVAKHIAEPGIIQLAEQQGDPDLIWGINKTGRLVALTYKQKEDISGWSRHYIGGSHINDNGTKRSFGRVLSMCSVPQATGPDRLWLCVERFINGRTVRSTEYLTDAVTFTDRNDFFSDEPSLRDDVKNGNQEADWLLWCNAVSEVQKYVCNMDMAATYDGRDTGVAANANITPTVSAKGANGPFNSSTAVFTAAMVGREIWKQYDENGIGGGRARVSQYVSPTQVICDVLAPFDNTNVIQAGKWFLTSANISGLDHLEGQTVGITVDGAVHPDAVVTNGSVALQLQSSVVTVGLKYVGRCEGLNVDIGGTTGSAAYKNRTAISFAIQVMDTLGISFGTSPYYLTDANFRQGGQIGDRPPPPYSGIIRDGYTDRAEKDAKKFVIVQRQPVPAKVLVVDLKVNTSDVER